MLIVNGFVSRLLLLTLTFVGSLPLRAAARAVDFDLPAQPVADALLAFSQQARTEVLFSFDELRAVRSNPVSGRLEPADALMRLLRDTGFAARRSRGGKFVISAELPARGAVEGRLLLADGTPARDIRITVPDSRRATRTDDNGRFEIAGLEPGTYRLAAVVPGQRPLQLEGVRVEPGRMLTLGDQTMPPGDAAVLDPFVVEVKSERWRAFRPDERPATPRTATGNLDLGRSEDDALPFTFFDRAQIARSGVVDLNEFLRRELLEGSAASSGADQDPAQSSFATGSRNLSLRGYGAEETVVLIDGRRLPEIVSSTTIAGRTPTPDVNFIPLSLVERVEVLPASASALYSGNAVGGVINIILRNDTAQATEVSATYTNALGGYDASQTVLALLHGESLLDGRLRLRLSASFTGTMPPTEAELGYREGAANSSPPSTPLFRITPNVRSTVGTPLFGPGTPSTTSVAPGADGTGGLAAFAGRAGLASTALFDSPGKLAASLDSVDYAYGRRQARSAYFGSAVYDLFPWLQIGVDGIHSQTVVDRGFDVFNADLAVPAGSPANPFAQDVTVSLIEIAPLLGERHSQARIDFNSLVLGLLVKLPDDWRVHVDTQYAHNVVKYRGIAGADPTRWQQLVTDGVYSPFRDTRVFGPPAEFYDRVLTYYGARDRFVSLGDYTTVDLALRLTQEHLTLPTGPAVLNLGGDYRRNQLANYTNELRYGDGVLAAEPDRYLGRTLERFSVFGEVQAPLWPARRLPRGLTALTGDLAVRYIAADTSQETNVAPTFALKADFAGGLSARGSVTTSNRFPTPQMTRLGAGGNTGAGPVDPVFITDPRRGETYTVLASEALNPSLLAEEAVTQTAGLLFRRGREHHFRAALDFFDTRKTNEAVILQPQDVMNLEALYPERITREPPAPGSGRVTSLRTGLVNAAWRHSQNWKLSVDYAWTGLWGGTLDLSARWIYFSRYDRELAPGSPEVDELTAPSTNAPDLLPHRGNFSAGWSRRDFGLGVESRYLHARVLPLNEQARQGGREVDAYHQFDAYVQQDLARWLPWKDPRRTLRAQLRVNNVFATGFPTYVNHSSGAGVQPYGDWRLRTFSLSLTAAF